MKYGALAYFNRRPMAMLDGYREGDSLEVSRVAIFPEAPTAESAAEVVFAALNDDDRPNGRTERSLSVGDVVRITVPPEHDGATGWYEWFAVAPIGFDSIAEPEGLGS